MAANEEVPDFLNISVVAANGLKNTALLGKQDVYVSATYGPYTLKTSTVKNGGSAPLWPGGPETFNFVMDGSPKVHIQVWVPHRTKDDVEIGCATVQENAWTGLQRGAPPREALIPLYTKDGKPAGTLKTFVSITLGPPGYAPPRPQYGAPVMGIPANGAPQQPYGGQQQQMQPPGQAYSQPQQGYGGAPYGAAGPTSTPYQETPVPYQETPARYQETPAPYNELTAAAAAQGSAGPYTQNPFAPQQQGQANGAGVQQVPSYPPSAQQQPGYPPQQPGYPSQYVYPPQQQQQLPYGQQAPYGAQPYPPQGGMPVVYGSNQQQQRPYGRGMGGGMGGGGMLMAGGAGLMGGMLIGSALSHDHNYYGDGGYNGDSNIDVAGGDMGGGDMGGGDGGGGGE